MEGSFDMVTSLLRRGADVNSVRVCSITLKLRVGFLFNGRY